MLIALAEDLELSAVLQRTEAIIAVACGDVSAAALHADWLVMGAGATLTLRGGETPAPALAGALVWRIGGRASSLLLLGPDELSANEALERGIADAVAPIDVQADALLWTRDWFSSRGNRAFDVAALLLRSRGGDALERALFAWLFATGEPQEGLRAFLEKRPARFRR
ncbi:MAG: enoyl-CoA hydratase-related protein [Thermoanaerobaculia bacterium]